MKIKDKFNNRPRRYYGGVVNGNLIDKFLKKHIGKKWDDIYSLWTRKNNFNKEEAYLMENMIKHSIDQNVVEIDGKLYFNSDRGQSMLPHSFCDFYVCPKTGNLEYVPKEFKYSYKPLPKEEVKYIYLAKNHKLEKVDGIWFEIKIFAEEDEFFYFSTGRNVKQLSKVELKKFNLKNDAIQKIECDIDDELSDF